MNAVDLIAQEATISEPCPSGTARSSPNTSRTTSHWTSSRP